MKNLVPSWIRDYLKKATGIQALLEGVRALQDSIVRLEKNLYKFQDDVRVSFERLETDIEDVRVSLARLETDIVVLRERCDQLEEYHLPQEGESPEPELARGYFHNIDYEDGELKISGWMLLPDREFDRYALYVNQKKVGESEVFEFTGVAKDSPHISHGRNSGFRFNVPDIADEMEGMVDLCVVGIARDREIAKFETWYHKDLASLLPAPPTHLMVRQNQTSSPILHFMTGLQSYREFWTAACRHTDPASIKSMLDWGCGCGRIIGFFLKFSGIPKICGCDVDHEAIAWCRENLKLAEFSTLQLYPPSPYEDNAFDLIISFSVLTHLSREVQAQWLAEMRRILSPGGLFIATVHGEFAARFTYAGRKPKDLMKKGIVDETSIGTLDGLVPEGYYLGVFQSKQYTMEAYSEHFEILEYIDRGGGSFQDLVVMRSKD